MATAWPDYSALGATDGTGAANSATVTSGIPVNPPPATVGKRLRIETASQARRQMVKIFREMREGSLDANKGSKLIYVLTEISRALERETVEKLNERLEAVERIK